MQLRTLICTTLLTLSSASAALAHSGPTLLLSVDGSKLRVQGASVTPTDTIVNLRPYDNVIHEHWQNVTVGTTLFAETETPTFHIGTPDLNGYDLTFDILSGLYGWDGIGTPSLGSTSAQLTIQPGSGPSIATTGGFVAGFTLATNVSDDFDVDLHKFLDLDGHPTEWSAVEIELQAVSVGHPTYTSDPTWIVFAPQEDSLTGTFTPEQVHLNAVAFEQFIANNIIPEPASAGLFVMLGGLVMMRRKQRVA